MHHKGRLKYPKHIFKPEDYLTFTELAPFSRLWNRLDLTDDDLLLVQLAIICDPDGPPVIPDCGGVRKIRFQPVNSGKGKSGGMRCLFKFFDEYKTVVLALVYPKNVMENISNDDKKRIRDAISDYEKSIGKGDDS